VDALLRAGLIEMLGRFGEPQVIAEATRRFQEFVDRPASLPAELKPAVMHVVGRYCDEATYRQLHELAKKARGLEEKQLFYSALERVVSPDLAERTLQLALTDELPPLYAACVVSGVSQSGRHAARAWNFAKERMPQLIEKVPDAMRNRYVPSIFGGFSEAERADELEKYVKENLPADALKKAEEIADGIRFRYSFKQRQIEKIDDWVRQRGNR
jgi:aminopeptidase N